MQAEIRAIKLETQAINLDTHKKQLEMDAGWKERRSQWDCFLIKRQIARDLVELRFGAIQRD